MAVSSLGTEAQRFGRSTILYLAPTLLVRGITFILTPLYTRAMGPEDFATIAVANTITTVFAILFGLGLYGCITRLFFDHDVNERRTFFGTLLLISFAVPIGFALILYPIGLSGHLDIFRTVKFHPHLELVLWTAILSVYPPLPISVYTAAEQPKRVAVLSMVSAATQLGLTLVFVSIFRQGAVGVLRANLLATALMAAISIVLMVRMSRFSFALPGAAAALAYALPLVPHLMGNWALAISDRLILDRYVPAADVGRYALGGLFGQLVGMIAAAVGQALGPMANRQLKDPRTAPNVPPLGTYATLIVVTASLAISLTAREVLGLVAPRSYETAIVIVPWIILGSFFQGLYIVWSTGTWFSTKTRLVPLITLVSASLNIVTNLMFVPHFGILAAAVSTAICYAVTAVLHGALAHKLHPIAWEYRRWILAMTVAIAWYAISSFVPTTGWLVPLGLKLLIVGVGFPASLLTLQFFSREEISRIKGAFRSSRDTSGTHP